MRLSDEYGPKTWVWIVMAAITVMIVSTMVIKFWEMMT